ncbi:DUF3168 domain-containing protein [Bosea sp. (in: a-proteobacteria)]|uniref:DUF3168 domain-containing protein n=1 Tax=Bosea sp. (in: a-proteobacteria) TaxID=1871050 RepID=UPI001AC029ED|nr:DUF3168 domain-containing protein [Bosea sp. (in: a-proteobacteria)]MBN9437031.1 DUF3168 domain-containing protein [Bosea sp. (in: a-proteobacteria)]
MTEPSLAIQTLLYARLIADPAVTALVPVANISDRSSLPTVFPSIIIGEGVTLYSDRYDSFHEAVSATVHVWTEETGLVQAKEIAGAVRAALRDAPWATADHTCHGVTMSSGRFLRDPSGEHGHAVLHVDAILQERAA